MRKKFCRIYDFSLKLRNAVNRDLPAKNFSKGWNFFFRGLGFWQKNFCPLGSYFDFVNQRCQAAKRTNKANFGSLFLSSQFF